MNLRHKTSLLVGLIVILVLSGSGLYMHFSVERNLRDSVYSNIAATSLNTAVTIGNYLTNLHQDSAAIAWSIPLESLARGDYQAVERRLAEINGIYKNFRNGLFILGPNGDLLVDWPPHPEKRGQNFAFRSYFKRTVAAGRGIMGDPYRSARTGEPVMTATVYLEDADGTFLGVLGCSAQLLDENGIGDIRNRQIGREGYIYVFDQARKLLLHPNADRILAKDVPPGANRVFDQALEGFEGVGETINSKGISMLLAVYRVPGTTWIVGAQQPTSEAFAGVHNTELEIFLASLACAALAALFGWWGVGRILRPLHQLEDSVKDLELPREDDKAEEFQRQPALDRLSPLASDAEFGELATLIRTLYLGMVNSLMVSRKANLDMQVAQEDLTQALDASWQLTEQLESNHRILAEQTAALEEANLQLKQTQSQMLQQEKMASVGQLAAGVAHEINNPMGFITSNLNTLGKYLEKIRGCDAELITQLKESLTEEDFRTIEALRRRGKLDIIFEDIPELLEESLDGATRVREIVQNLKTFSRIDEAEAKEANLNECIESTLKIVWNEIKYKAQIEKDYGDIPPLSCYPQQLNQVVMNILVNGAHAIEKSGVINIRTWAEGESIFIAIADNGCGMNEETRKRLFEPFYTTKDVGKGTGLGMSIAWDIIQKHDGEIVVDSTPGEGTTFTIQLPIKSTLDTEISEESAQQAVSSEAI